MGDLAFINEELFKHLGEDVTKHVVDSYITPLNFDDREGELESPAGGFVKPTLIMQDHYEYTGTIRTFDSWNIANKEVESCAIVTMEDLEAIFIEIEELYGLDSDEEEDEDEEAADKAREIYKYTERHPDNVLLNTRYFEFGSCTIIPNNRTRDELKYKCFGFLQGQQEQIHTWYAPSDIIDIQTALMKQSAPGLTYGLVRFCTLKDTDGLTHRVAYIEYLGHSYNWIPRIANILKPEFWNGKANNYEGFHCLD